MTSKLMSHMMTSFIGSDDPITMNLNTYKTNSYSCVAIEVNRERRQGWHLVTEV